MRHTVAEGLAILLGLGFLAGGVVNLIGPPPLRASYARWGYPKGFQLVTGVLELTASVLLVLQATRLFGIVLAAVVSLAALATVVRHKEWSHTPPAIVLLAALGGLAALSLS